MSKTLQYFKLMLSWIIICLIFAAIGYWIYHFVAHPKKRLKPAKIQTVTLALLRYHTLPQIVEAYGTTISPKSTALKSQTSGTIATIDFKAGEHVKKGQVLFTLLSNDISTQAKKLYAAMLLSKSFFERQKRANKLLPGSVSPYDIQKSKLQYEQDLASYAESSTVNTISAPFNGIISDTNLAVGSYVAMGATMASLTDPHSLQITYQLPSQDAPQVKIGQAIAFYPDGATQPIAGTVSYISPQYDAQNYNLTLRADVKNTSIKPNFFGRIVETTNPNYKTLAVSQSLVQADAQGFYVYTIEDKKVTKHYIKTGMVDKNGLIQIVSGIAPNTPIISSDIANLSDGQTVQVTHP